MHPAVAEPVSRLSYEGELHAHPVAALRSLDGVAPGLHPVAVDHRGNATTSPEEAAAVVELVARAPRPRRGSDATDAARQPRRAPLAQRDLIVVTPYNAQLSRRCDEALDAAGFADVPVGTVDKFQGQEAAVAIVSLAASSAADAPRGLEFLLLQEPAQRRDLAREVGGLPRLLARAARRPAPHARGGRAAERLHPPRRAPSANPR